MMALERDDVWTLGVSAAALLAWYGVARVVLGRWRFARHAGGDDAATARAFSRARSWLLTVPIAAAFVVGGLRPAAALVGSFTLGVRTPDAAGFPLDGPGMMRFVERDALGSRQLSLAYMAFCALDLLVGVVDYAGELQVLTGWVHHSAYTIIVLWLCGDRSTLGFTAFGVIELPTLVMAAGAIVPALHSEAVFGATFAATRLGYYSLLAVPAVRHASWVRVALVVLVFGLHCYWMAAWWQRQTRLTAKARAAADTTAVASNSAAVGGRRGVPAGSPVACAAAVDDELPFKIE